MDMAIMATVMATTTTTTMITATRAIPISMMGLKDRRRWCKPLPPWSRPVRWAVRMTIVGMRPRSTIF
jgi:hypothetical protein